MSQLVLLRLDSNKVCVNQWNTDHRVSAANFDATGRSDGPDYMGRTYDDVADTFSTLPIPPLTRAEELKALTPWTASDRNEALEIFLRDNI